ncbi:MAG: hypothetical protein ABI591_05650 [Kofleriaceae bacterium]
MERATVRLEDVNGPKGGIDSACRIKLVLAGRPSVLIEKRAASYDVAFAQAVRSVGSALQRTRAKHLLRGSRRVAPVKLRPAKPLDVTLDGGELIGRRVGRGPDAKARAVARPDKQDRTLYVDTAAPERSASDRRAGGATTVRRNARVHHPSATASLEDSRTRPSRKSTRRSANRGTPSQTKARAIVAALSRSSARSARRG